MDLLKLAFAASFTTYCAAQSVQSLAAEYEQLKIHTALVAPSAGVDDTEFVRNNLRTSFVIRPKGRKPFSLWTSDLENCGDTWRFHPMGRGSPSPVKITVLLTNLSRVLGSR